MSSNEVVITGTGLFTPPYSISNAELAASLSIAVNRWNHDHAAEIERGELTERTLPDEEFIERASGIKSRFVMEKQGVLDPDRLRPHLPLRGEDELGLQAEMALPAIHEALAQAGRRPDEVDCVIVGCSNIQRAYPAVAVEIQHALGAGGWGYDMNVACSSATFSMQAGVDALKNGSADCVVVVHPEITSGHNNFALRDHHFIFGDACTAVVLERETDAVPGREQWKVLGLKLSTKFSNSIRNDFGFLNACEDGERDPFDLVFRQRGQQVFKEVVPLVTAHINQQLDAVGMNAESVSPFLAAPGEPEDEPAHREAGARPRAERAGGARHPRPLRQHLVGRLRHRVPPAPRRPGRRRRRGDLQLRCRLQHRQPGGAQGLTPTASPATACGRWASDVPRSSPDRGARPRAAAHRVRTRSPHPRR